MIYQSYWYSKNAAILSHPLVCSGISVLEAAYLSTQVFLLHKVYIIMPSVTSQPSGHVSVDKCVLQSSLDTARICHDYTIRHQS